MGLFVIIVIAVMFVLIKVRNGKSDNHGEKTVSQATTTNNTYSSVNNSPDLATWQEMKKLQDNMDRSIFSGDFHVTGNGPYYIEYIGFASNLEAFNARQKFIERLYDGTPYDAEKEALCRSVIVCMFGESTSMPISDSLIEDDISEDGSEMLRINYAPLSLPHRSSYQDAEKVISGYKRWLSKNS